MSLTEKNNISKIAASLTRYTCQLYVDKLNKAEYFQPFGTGVLFAHNNSFYLLSCAHVLFDQTENPPFILKSKNEISTIGGEYISTGLPLSNNREDDKFDFCIVKLNEETYNNFIGVGHKFLDESFILTGYHQKQKDLALAVGYPTTRTKVNVQKKTISSKGLKYVSQFVKYDLSKDGFSHDFHFMVKYSINNFAGGETKNKSRGPNPHGLSGSGLWRLSVDESNKLSVKLVGILTEYRQSHSVIIATRIDLIMDCIKQKFDNTVKNYGSKISIS